MSDGGKNPADSLGEWALGGAVPGNGGSRRLLLISVALNIFFIAASGAYLARHYMAPEAYVGGSRGDHNPAKRIEALAERLPVADAEALRAEFGKRAEIADQAREALHQKKDAVRRALEAQSFDPVVVRSAMSEFRAAHDVFTQVLQDIIATAAARMSPEGRRGLADFGRRERRSER